MHLNRFDRGMIKLISWQPFKKKPLQPVKWAVGKLAEPSMIRQGDKFIERTEDGKVIRKYDILRNHLDGAMGIWMSSFYIFNVNKNKDIPKDKKQFLNIDIATNTAIGLAGGYGISKFIKTAAKKGVNNVMEHFDKTITREADKKLVKSGVKALIPMLAFTFAFRFLGPVLSTPIAGIIKKKIKAHNKTDITA